jgi:hypothetical protein
MISEEYTLFCLEHSSKSTIFAQSRNYDCMKRLSKSRYTAFCQCPKNLWLKVYKPKEATIDAGMEASRYSLAQD